MGKSKKKSLENLKNLTESVAKSVDLNKNEELEGGKKRKKDETDSKKQQIKNTENNALEVDVSNSKKKKRKSEDQRKLENGSNNVASYGRSDESATPGHMMRITDISNHQASQGTVGPLLASFSHAPCSSALVAAARPSCSVTTEWQEDWPKVSLVMSVEDRQYEAPPTTRGLFTTYLAIRDKASGRTRLVEALPVVLSPKVQGF